MPFCHRLPAVEVNSWLENAERTRRLEVGDSVDCGGVSNRGLVLDI